MKAVTNLLDQAFTPLRPKFFKVISPKDLHDDHVALDRRLNNVSTKFQRCETEHDTIENNLDSLSDEHVAILTKIGPLSKTHGTLQGQIDEFDRRIPGILEDIRKRTIEHDTFNKGIYKISETVGVRDLLSKEHAAILNKTSPLSETHGVLRDQVNKFDGRIPDILKDIKLKITEHNIFSKRISGISKRVDTIESKLDFVRNRLPKLEPSCSKIRKSRRILRVPTHTATYFGTGEVIQLRDDDHFSVTVPMCWARRPHPPGEIRQDNLPIAWEFLTSKWGRGFSPKTARCVANSAVDAGVEYAVNHKSSLMGTLKMRASSETDWKYRGEPGLCIYIYDLESTVRRDFRSARTVDDAEVYIRNIKRGSGSGHYYRVMPEKFIHVTITEGKVLRITKVPEKFSPVTIKHPKYYPVTKGFKITKNGLAYLIAWLVKRR